MAAAAKEVKKVLNESDCNYEKQMGLYIICY